MWNTSYTGNKTITERLYYSADNGPWVLFNTITHRYPYAPDIISATEYVDYAQLDVRKLPPGGYKIKVYATASDAPDDEIMTDATKVGGAGKTYIKLEAPGNARVKFRTLILRQLEILWLQSDGL